MLKIWVENMAHEKRIRLRKDDSGIAATVGTIMTILVFVLVLSFYTMYYVPVYMKDVESRHMTEISNDFMMLKSTIDLQIMKNDRSIVMYTPIKLGSDRIPVFTESTSGAIALNTEGGSIEVKSSDGRCSYKSNGNIVFSANNRYLATQSFIYEGGAIIISQPEGEVVRVGLPIITINKSNSVSMKITLTSLAGINESVAGIDVWSVKTTLLGKETYGYYWDAVAVNITINITSEFSTAWERFFNNTLGEALGYGGSNYNVSKAAKTLSINISNIKELEITYAVVTTKLGGT
jgi:hypothetical protein